VGWQKKQRDLASGEEVKGEIQFQNKRSPCHVALARVSCPCKKLILAVTVHGKWRPYFIVTC